MKRSEMVEKLYNYIIQTNTPYNRGYKVLDCVNTREHASSILSILEEAGMLPPFNNHDFHMDGDNADKNSVTYRTWEPEDG
jgi:hypothetical protein